MTFPHQDPFGVEPARLVRDRAAQGATIRAPDISWWVFPRIHRYARTAIAPEQRHDWAIVHKGMLDALTRDALWDISTRRHPVLANEVFVVWGPHDAALRRLTDDDPDIVAAMLDLGRRAGPEYAYAFGVMARKDG